MSIGEVTPEREEALSAFLCRDPRPDRTYPARTLPVPIPSGGVNLNAVLYTASGAGPHPNVLLLHGLPGNEQNIDLAQTLRRAGWNVLTIHYRGSWGTPGTFSFRNCLEDAERALDWIQDAGDNAPFKPCADRTVLMGHSMGGFVALHLLAGRPEIRAAAIISGVDLGQAFGVRDRCQAESHLDETVGFGAGLHILAGTSAAALASEARTNAEEWGLASYAARLTCRQLLMVTADDGFAGGSDALADAIQGSEGPRLTRHHFATDHSYSDCRIRLQAAILQWVSGPALACTGKPSVAF